MRTFERFIDELPQGKEFSLIQIGAHSGVSSAEHQDPLAPLLSKEFVRGILVEPQAEIFGQLVDNYRGAAHRLNFENAAIGEHDGHTDLYLFENTLHASLKDDRGERSRRAVGSKKVSCVTLGTLMAKYQVRSLDLLCLDVEGYEFEILKTVDFTKIRPGHLYLEHRHIPPADKAACVSLLRGNGYRLIDSDDFDAFLTVSK